MHKTVFALGATLWGKLGRLGHKLKQHHVHAREDGKHMLQLPTSARLRSALTLPGPTQCPCIWTSAGELRRAAKRERRRHHSEHAEHNPLKFALPWQRKRRGHQHDGGIL